MPTKTQQVPAKKRIELVVEKVFPRAKKAVGLDEWHVPLAGRQRPVIVSYDPDTRAAWLDLRGLRQGKYGTQKGIHSRLNARMGAQGLTPELKTLVRMLRSVGLPVRFGAGKLERVVVGRQLRKIGYERAKGVVLSSPLGLVEEL